MNNQPANHVKSRARTLYFFVVALLALLIANRALAESITAHLNPRIANTTHDSSTLGSSSVGQQLSDNSDDLASTAEKSAAHDSDAEHDDAQLATYPTTSNVRTALPASGKIRAESVDSSIDNYLFNIHQAYTELTGDADHDGYYHEFSITFDADVQAEHAHVYAELYLSFDGGDWQHFFTTEEFTIYGDSSSDQYQVVTNLTSGYPTGSYDVLIDLYQVGDPYVVTTYSGDDSDELYGLPLEDAHRDEPVAYYVHHESHGGSYSFWMLCGLVLLVCMRKAGGKFAKHSRVNLL